MAQVWNQDGNYWYDDAVTDASGNPLPDQLTAWLKTVSGNAPYYGKVKDYLAGLQAQGLTTDDFDKALKAYGVKEGSKDIGWWGEDAMLRALGTGVDALNPDAAYKGAWKAAWSQGAENAQQKSLAEKHDANQANQGGDLDDLGDIALGFAVVLGAGAAAGAFGGAAAAGATAEAGATAAAAGIGGGIGRLGGGAARSLDCGAAPRSYAETGARMSVAPPSRSASSTTGLDSIREPSANARSRDSR